MSRCGLSQAKDRLPSHLKLAYLQITSFTTGAGVSALRLVVSEWINNLGPST